MSNSWPAIRTQLALGALLLSASLSQAEAQQGSPPSSLENVLAADVAGDLLKALFASDVEGLKLLLARNGVANKTLPAGEPVILTAAQFGTAEQVKLVLDAGSDPNTKGPGEWSPLFTAIAASRPNTVKLLLERGADPSAKADDGTSALALAEAVGDLETILALKQAMPGAIPGAEKLVLYHKAAAAGDAEATRTLLGLVGDVNAADDRGWTSLMYAAVGGHLEVVTLLIGAHSAVNHAARNGITPLMVAAMVGSEAVVQALLSAGANVSARNDFGQTAGAIALANGADDLAKVLGATPSAASLHQRVAAAAARRDHHEVKRLLNSGAPAAKPQGVESDTPATVAAACGGDGAIVRLLMERGAKTEEKDGAGVTPLIASALCNQAETARTLVQLGASAQARTKDGIDALTAALARGNADIVAAIAPVAAPSVETAVQILQRKDLKTLAILLRDNADLRRRSDRDGPILLRQAMLLNDPAVLEQVLAMANYDVNYVSSDKSLLAMALEAKSIQSVRTLLKMGAEPTRLLKHSPATTAMDIASKLGASEALQAMSLAAKKQISAIQATLVTLGHLSSAADGSWGPATQAAWDKAKPLIKNNYAIYAEEALTQESKNYLRVCNQTGGTINVALYVWNKQGGSGLHAWWQIDNAQCKGFGEIDKDESYYVGIAERALAGANKRLCTADDRMEEKGPANIMPPCRPKYRETSFAEVTDPSKPFVAR